MAPQLVIGDIIAKALVLVDTILGAFVSVTYTPGNVAMCIPSTYSNGTLSVCGTLLTTELPMVITSLVSMLNAVFSALGIFA